MKKLILILGCIAISVNMASCTSDAVPTASTTFHHEPSVIDPPKPPPESPPKK